MIDILYLYLIVGILFAIWFVIKPVHILDKRMPRPGWKMKMILLPGLVFLWPLVLRQWIKKRYTR